MILEGRLGAQEGSMRAPDGPGEAPAGRPGGCKMLIFHWFYNVFKTWSIWDKGNHVFCNVFCKMEHRGQRKHCALLCFQQYGA